MPIWSTSSVSVKLEKGIGNMTELAQTALLMSKSYLRSTGHSLISRFGFATRCLFFRFPIAFLFGVADWFWRALGFDCLSTSAASFWLIGILGFWDTFNDNISARRRQWIICLTTRFGRFFRIYRWSHIQLANHVCGVFCFLFVRHTILCVSFMCNH